MTDPYASEEETQALLVPDTRTAAEKRLHTMMDERGAWEQGTDSFSVLHDIALELLTEQERKPAQIAGFDVVIDTSMPFNTMKFVQPAPVQQEPVAFGPVAKRRVFDYIRGAYDLGYNDARNARAIPGDGAPGYKGRDVEADHGSALLHALEAITSPPAQRKPLTSAEDAWIARKREAFPKDYDQSRFANWAENYKHEFMRGWNACALDHGIKGEA